MKPEIIKLDGKSFVILPLNEFKAMSASLEELEDIRSFDAAVAKKEPSYPNDVLKQLLSGENPIKVFRNHRGLTQQALAEKIKITRPYLAALESGTKQGSIAMLKSIAKALNVDLDDIA